jgi:putative ABC transport system permease protein
MTVTWHKIWRDLVHRGNRARTILAVLSTAVGVFALGLVFGLSGVMQTRMVEVHRGTIPAHITFWGGPFSQETIDTMLREPDVIDAEGETSTSFRWKLEGEDEWRDGELVARADYRAQRMDLLRLLDGHWPAERALGMERLASRYFDVSPGTSLLVEIGQRERRLPVEGILRAHMVFPPQWGGDAMFFATPETASWLTNRDMDFNVLRVRLESFSEERAEETAQRIEDRLERMGLSVRQNMITDPDVHWQQDMLDGMFLVFGVLGVLSLGLSGFLIVNTMNGIVAQQMWQIGVMKAVGATFGRLIRTYLMIALIYGGLALVLAVPLGTIGAYWMAVWLLDLFNITVDTFQVAPNAVIAQIVVGGSVPLLAALVPVVGGARATAHEAIGTYGLGGKFGHGWFDQLIGRVRHLPRPLALSLRNTFRRKARVALTLLTLAFSGVLFVMIMSVGDSFDRTIDNVFEQMGNDISVYLDRPHRVSRLVEVAKSVDDVVGAEVWGYQGATFPLASGEEHQVALIGVPYGSVMFDPQIVSGRYLLPDDGRAVLVNQRLAEEEGIHVGDELELTIGQKESTWTVVGLSLSINSFSDDFFVPFDALAQEAGTVDRGTQVQVLSEHHDVESHRRLREALRDAYTARRIKVTGFWSAAEGREQNRTMFSTMIYTLMSMAVLTAAVGSIGLMSTMSTNVVERRREVGVMRAIGAPSLAIVFVFVGEGVLLGVLSWLLAVPLSIPSAHLFSEVIGNAVIHFPLDFAYSMDGVLLWLAIVVVLSTLASLWPSLQATKVSVREALAYE